MPRWYNTLPLPIVDLPADTAHRGKGASVKPEIIVLHATAGIDSRKWLTTTKGSNVSVHRLIPKDGTIYKCMDDEVLAWHVGNATMYPSRQGRASNANLIALGIEIENKNDGKDNYTWMQYLAAAAQCSEWWGKYGYLPILAHGWIDVGKDDPVGWDWNVFMDRVMRDYVKNAHKLAI